MDFNRCNTDAHPKRSFDWRNVGVLIPKNPLAIVGIFRSLRNRNFFIYFIGLAVSMCGTWIQQLAMGWLVYSMTNSVFMLSLTVFLSQIPTLVITPFAGVVCDRFDRRTIILCTQGALMVQSVILAALTLTGTITMPIIMALCLWEGIAVSFDAPARQSFYSLLVPPKDLSNAIAVNSTAINATRFIGPALGGVMVAKFGEGICFLINAISFLAIFLSLLLIKIPHKKHADFSMRGALSDLMDGVRYVSNSVPILAVLLILFVVSFFGVPFPMLMAAFTKGVLGGDSQTLGTLMGFIGVGTLTAALYLAARKSVLGLGRVIIVCAILFGASLMLISIVRWMPAVYFICYCIGFTMISVAASCNTMLQALVDEEHRGRIMSMFTMAFFGIPPLGSIAQGYISNFIPMPFVVFVCGLFCIAGGLVMEYYRPLIRKHSREIYTKRGIIIPEIASGLSSSSGKH